MRYIHSTIDAMSLTRQQVYAALDFAARIYLAYYLFDYGLSKLNGGMFNNATTAILQTPLQQVDSFHLTWYSFHRNPLLTHAVGILQILSALLLIINRTVLLGCALALPILINILLIDISVFPDMALAVRVSFYIILVLAFCFYRKQQVIAILNIMLQPTTKLVWKNVFFMLLIPIILLLLLAVELLLIKIA